MISFYSIELPWSLKSTASYKLVQSHSKMLPKSHHSRPNYFELAGLYVQRLKLPTVRAHAGTVELPTQVRLADVWCYWYIYNYCWTMERDGKDQTLTVALASRAVSLLSNVEFRWHLRPSVGSITSTPVAVNTKESHLITQQLTTRE